MIHIARAIDKPHATIFSYLRYHGGIELSGHYVGHVQQFLVYHI